MRRVLLVAGTAIAMGSSAAVAADLPRAPSYMPIAAAYNWSGAYAGVNLGYQWGTTDNNPTRPSGVLGGLQLGYNWQSGQFVLGGETDIQISGADDTFAPWKFSNPWFGTLRARAGFAMQSFLLYATGGFAYGGIKGEIPGLSESKTHGGWTVGGGVEVGLNPSWTAKVEYLYVSLSDRLYTITGVQNGLWSNIVRFGVNYRF